MRFPCKGNGTLYGTHPFLWYIYAGIPAICGAVLPPFLWETYDLSNHVSSVMVAASESEPTSLKTRFAVLGIITPYVILHSFSAHKEFRFILPILPLILVLAGHALTKLFDAAISAKSKILTQSRGIVAIIILNFPQLFYLGVVHQRGPIAVNQYLTDTISKIVDIEETINIHYLMGCHSAPLYSHLHIPGVYINAWHLDCSPQCRSQHEVLCESDSFLKDPPAFVIATYNKEKSSDAVVCKNDAASQCSLAQLEEFSTKEIPTYVIVMQEEAKQIENTLLNVIGMTHVASIPHTVKSLKWLSRKADETCHSPSLNCHEVVRFFYLLGMEFDHIEVYYRLTK